MLNPRKLKKRGERDLGGSNGQNYRPNRDTDVKKKFLLLLEVRRVDFGNRLNEGMT